MKKPVPYLLFLLVACTELQAQSPKRLFIGIQPGITRELKGKEENIFSFNVLPLVAQGFSMNLGLQLGASYFFENGPAAGWRNHAGLKFSLGYTFR